MLQHADEVIGGKINGRKWSKEFTEDFDYVDYLEKRIIESGYLLAKDMKKCNKLYDRYKVVYEKSN